MATAGDSMDPRIRMQRDGLYDPFFEHSSCGVGFVVNVDGRRTHQIILNGITILMNLVHRGAVGGDSRTGDGAGMLVQMPHRFFVREADRLGFSIPGDGLYGVAMLFMPLDDERRSRARELFEDAVVAGEGTLLGWRDVPANPELLGEMALVSMPHITQAFVSFPELSGEALERKLYVTRKVIESMAAADGFSMEELYLNSFSSRTIVYKGMFVAPQFAAFYPDLADPDFESALAVIHQRYSTNTFPSWSLAQPFRFIAHNINKMNARELTMSSPLFGDDISKLSPVIQGGQSDSGIFDNVLELLVAGGRSLEHALMMMVPEAFGQRYHMSEDKRAFYEYHAAIMEPWDGPAAISFSDGITVGSILDRNGLRPARWVVTRSGLVVLASEVGVLDIPPEDVLQKGRLAPGKMFLVDTAQKRIIYDNEVKAAVSRRKPYRRWVEANRIELKGLFQVSGPVSTDHAALQEKQWVFGYTMEDIDMLITPMVENSQEPISSMGNDQSLAVLSDRPQLLYNYFKQLFAQVTNPPIDPYRENLVMSLMSYVGREKNLLEETPEHVRQVKLPHPILSNDDIAKLRTLDVGGYRSCVISMTFVAAEGEKGLEKSLDALCAEAEARVDAGYTMLIITDREVNAKQAPIPALLATSALHHHLTRVKKRHLTALVIETAEAREVMHFATLMGFGASAINPYLAIETIADLKARGRLSASLNLETAIEHYITSLKKGLLKVMSKMGVSTIRSYKSAQIFEAVGLAEDFVQKYFRGTPSRIGGIGIEGIAREVLSRHSAAYSRTPEQREALDSGGAIHFRSFSEGHRLSPQAIALVQRAVRENDYSLYQQYAASINDESRSLCTLRGLFSFAKRDPVPLDEVEPVESIVKRFVTSAMSFGSISKEAHVTLAIAMNRLGAASNSGEGGEDDSRYTPLPNGDSARSAIKQVASARFGVTSHYLVNSRELQIKIAQGAKPGEGGQLAGLKVDLEIAKVRHSTPGVTLISPPPHHDIYSIEDLAQLIFDLKSANPEARVSVKLVAEVGVGTIAAGVAKGKADMVLIAGYDGGTGNSPISSIKHAGIPWEIGVADTQQTLVMNRLRDRIRVQADGQMRTGRDIVIAALLGAEEYGFGTISLVAIGCIMMRKCHLNTCPVGVATQDPRLRARFTGTPEHVVNFMRFVAQDAREIMASLGFRTVDEMVGHVEALETRTALDHWKSRGLDFSRVLARPEVHPGTSLRCTTKQHHDMSLSLDKELILKSRPALEAGEKVRLFMTIRNCNRTVGATLSSEVSRRHGAQGLPSDTINVSFTGSAGQSFGGFLAHGITFELEGDANDYFAKGLSGGKIIVYPPRASTFRARDNIITGNVNLFGATGGEVYINGMAGERFAVRNSGAVAIVEGLGDHGCEYMTGGLVVVLGRTGVNFAAGMSGGIVYVLDEDQLFDTMCNLEMVDIEPVTAARDRTTLKELVERHVMYTRSEHATRILRDWDEMLPRFVKVMPIDYRKALERIAKDQARETEVVGLTEEVYR
jgi:glutamate synthase domain-containing protein 2/glutamate synthase domain-containing protein 1/glutamate synthase domain-containing protein 3